MSVMRVLSVLSVLFVPSVLDHLVPDYYHIYEYDDATGGDLGRIYPEGEDDLTSLGGRQRHLKFGKIDSESAAAA